MKTLLKIPVSNKWSKEEVSLLQEEHEIIVHQEKPASVDEPGKVQECRELESNSFAGAVFKKQRCHDNGSIAQANQRQGLLRSHHLQFEETASNSLGGYYSRETTKGDTPGCKSDVNRMISATAFNLQNLSCVCKSSKCLEHCLCSLFKVGCSTTCQCEGCQNSYGKRGELYVDDVNHHSLPPLTNHATPFRASWDRTHGNDIRVRGLRCPQLETTNATGIALKPPTFPKRLDATDNPSHNKEGNNTKTGSTPFWHKQGCGCTKSKCVRTTCDCYRYKSGCSDKCRCRGCENSYGEKKDEAARNKLGERKGSKTGS